MRVRDPGHQYDLHCLDSEDGSRQTLTFVKRVGPRYPGNVGAHGGTTTQEVLRALIDRTKYVDRQIHHRANDTVLDCLMSALWALENRARDERGQPRHSPSDFVIAPDRLTFEQMKICPKCAHVDCLKHEPDFEGVDTRLYGERVMSVEDLRDRAAEVTEALKTSLGVQLVDGDGRARSYLSFPHTVEDMEDRFEMTKYETEIVATFKRLCKEQGGASPSEVTADLRSRGVLAALDTAIDIRDQMRDLRERGEL